MHLRGEEAAQQKGRGKPKDLGKKAVLMNGPPGIGKTSSAMILTRSADLCLMECLVLQIVLDDQSATSSRPSNIARQDSFCEA